MKFFVLSFIFLSLFFSCKKGEKGVVENGVSLESEVTEASANGAVIEESGTAVKKDAPVERIDDVFTERGNYRKVVPNDFKIGQLENLSSSDYQINLALETINGFLNQLKKGVLDKRYIHKNSLTFLEKNLNYYLEQNAIPDLYRIGKINWKNGNKSAVVNMRFYLDDSITDGKLILEEEYIDGKRIWVISDLQVDFMDLFQKYQKSKEEYEPNAYNFYDWE